MSGASEFDLQPGEKKLDCGCYAELRAGVWVLTGQAFLCPESHRLGDQVPPAGEPKA